MGHAGIIPVLMPLISAVSNWMLSNREKNQSDKHPNITDVIIISATNFLLKIFPAWLPKSLLYFLGQHHIIVELDPNPK